MILDIDDDGDISPLELCSQDWQDGRLKIIDCNPIIINGNYNWINISSEIPEFINDLNEIESLLMPYNDMVGLVPESICDLGIDFSNPNSFDLRSNSLCPPYPECIEDYMWSQSNWGTDSCEISDCYDVGVEEEIAIIELDGDNILNPLQDSQGVGSILANIHNDGPSCSGYPGLMVSTDTDGIYFLNFSPYEQEGQIVNWWYAIFADYTYFSNILFQVSPFVPVGEEITFTLKAVTMGCTDEGCDVDPYCHECPLTDSVSVSVVVGENFPNKLGDANIDGGLNVLDVILLVNYILNYNEGEYDESMQLFIYITDMNFDYSSNILDVVLLAESVLSP